MSDDKAHNGKDMFFSERIPLIYFQNYSVQRRPGEFEASWCAVGEFNRGHWETGRVLREG